MKKIILLIALSFVYNGVMAYRTIVIEKAAGGPNGYNKIEETFEDEEFAQHYELYCEDPGSNDCKFTKHVPASGPGPSPTIIDAEVMNLIASGALSGSTVIGNATVSWTGENKYNYKLTIIYE